MRNDPQMMFYRVDCIATHVCMIATHPSLFVESLLKMHSQNTASTFYR